MTYRQELEDDQSVSGYYVSVVVKEQEPNADEERDNLLGKKPTTKQMPKTETSVPAPLVYKKPKPFIIFFFFLFSFFKERKKQRNCT